MAAFRRRPVSNYVLHISLQRKALSDANGTTRAPNRSASCPIARQPVQCTGAITSRLKADSASTVSEMIASLGPTSTGADHRGYATRSLNLRFRLHALQKAKRVERANGDQLEAHYVRFTQRQLFEHFVGDGRIGDVDDESHAPLSAL